MESRRARRVGERTSRMGHGVEPPHKDRDPRHDPGIGLPGGPVEALGPEGGRPRGAGSYVSHETRRGAVPPFRTSPRIRIARAKPALERDMTMRSTGPDGTRADS